MDTTDKEYVEHCRNGCPDDYRFLVERYQGPLFAYLASRLGAGALAEEAAQESFVRAFFALPELKKPDHLVGCPACQVEQTRLAVLRQRLLAHGELASHLALAPRVLGRIRLKQAEKSPAGVLLRTWFKWATGLSVATAAVVLTVALLMPSRATARAVEVMVRGMQAAMRLTSVHLQGRVRSAPAENFAHLSPGSDFTSVELWKEWEGQRRWRVEKPGRVAVTDGQSTLLFLCPLKMALKVPAMPARRPPGDGKAGVAGEKLRESWAPFDTGWLHAVADIEQTLEAELRRAEAKGWKMAVTGDTDAAGAPQAVVTIYATSGLPQGDYLQNRFFDTADTRRVYRFDDRTGRLQAVEVYLQEASGEVLIFEVTDIRYNEAFSPECFQVELPPDVVWQNEKPQLPADPKYTALTAEQAARAFFEACGREDWNEVAQFWPLPLDDRLKGALGGLRLVSLGDAFGSAAYPGRFVPYEIQFKNGPVKKFNLALKKDKKTGRWSIDGASDRREPVGVRPCQRAGMQRCTA